VPEPERSRVGGGCPSTLLCSVAGCPAVAPVPNLGCWVLHPRCRGWEAEAPRRPPRCSPAAPSRCSPRQRRREGSGAAALAGAAGLPRRGGAGGTLPGCPAPRRLREENLRQQLRSREEAVGVRPAQAAGGECGRRGPRGCRSGGWQRSASWPHAETLP